MITASIPLFKFSHDLQFRVTLPLYKSNMLKEVLNTIEQTNKQTNHSLEVESSISFIPRLFLFFLICFRFHTSLYSYLYM